jgi:hypothetical protein
MTLADGFCPFVPVHHLRRSYKVARKTVSNSAAEHGVLQGRTVCLAFELSIRRYLDGYPARNLNSPDVIRVWNLSTLLVTASLPSPHIQRSTLG